MSGHISLKNGTVNVAPVAVGDFEVASKASGRNRSAAVVMGSGVPSASNVEEPLGKTKAGPSKS